MDVVTHVLAGACVAQISCQSRKTNSNQDLSFYQRAMIGGVAAVFPDMDYLLLLALTTNSLGYDGAGDFSMEKDGQLTRRAEKKMVPFVFAGVSIMHPHLFADSPDGSFSLNVLWDKAIEKQRLYGLRLEGEWMHIGTPDALKDAEEHLKIV